MELKSEFAQVRIELDESGNGPRLLIEDMRTGIHLLVDPLELESIAWSRHEDLAYLVDPARRWKGEDKASRLDSELRDLGVIP